MFVIHDDMSEDLATPCEHHALQSVDAITSQSYGPVLLPCPVMRREPAGFEAEAPDFVENLIRGRRPPKRLAVLVVRVDVGEDRFPQLRDRQSVRVPLEGLLRE
jgi:hypothetical protein